MEQDYTNYQLDLDEQELQFFNDCVSQFGRYRGQVAAQIGRQVVGSVFGTTIVEGLYVESRPRKQSITSVDCSASINSYRTHDFNQATLVAW